MVLGQIFCRFTGSAAQTHCARRPQLVSKKFLEEEIFAGTNFRELAFDRENRENFCLAKISRYMVDQLSTCLVSLVTNPRAPPGEKRHMRVGSGDETSVYLP